MKKVVLFALCFFLLSNFSFSQVDLLTAKTRAQLVAQLDSALRSKYFITQSEADKILEKPTFLKDSTYKLSSGLLRYSFTYVAKYVDSTSKGRLFFGIEQYKDTLAAKSNFEFLKKQNEKDGNLTTLKDLGDDAFLKKDALNQPFVMIVEENKIFKFQIFYLKTENSLNQLLLVAKKIVDTH